MCTDLSIGACMHRHEELRPFMEPQPALETTKAIMMAYNRKPASSHVYFFLITTYSHYVGCVRETVWSPFTAL